MAKEEYVAETDNLRTIVLSQRILVELGEGCCQPLLHLTRQRSTTVRPVDGHELGELIRTLNDSGERLRDEAAMRGMTGHLAHQKQRNVTELHVLPRLNRQGRNLLRIDLGNKLADTACDLQAVFVELILPEQAGKHGTAKSLLGRDRLRGGALVRSYRREVSQLQDIQLCHIPPPFLELSVGVQATTHFQNHRK